MRKVLNILDKSGKNPDVITPRMRRSVLCGIVAAAAISATACRPVGPNYARPPAPTPQAFKEPLPAGWKEGEPRDDAIRGKWWEIFNDPQLNALEEQVPANLNIAQAEAQFRAARAGIRITRSNLFPTVTAGSSTTNSHSAFNLSARGLGLGTVSSLVLPTVDFSWEADIWGGVRRAIENNVTTAQADYAMLENIRLSMQAEVATDYFELRGLDQEKQLLDSTVVAYKKALDLTNNRHDQGIASGADVAQAETQLDTTEAQSTDLDVQRATLEHAIAVLIAKPPAELTIPRAPITVPPPEIPLAMPSELLERRPDVASAERQMAAANAEIGVAKAAYYPTVSLSGSAGLESATLLNLFTWPSRFWSVGPSIVETIFDAGKRKATNEQMQANYDATVAAYRLNVLSAFQDVEDNLATLRVLANESGQQAEAVKAAEKSLQLALYQYQGGITAYLQVITAQSAALSAEVTQVQLLARRMTSSVALVKALGGGWNASAIPSARELALAP
jgi:NodT family efflux transporter outer membrane factor (OMF) lipoprotein